MTAVGVTARTDKPAYEPGEPIVVTLEWENVEPEPLPAPSVRLGMTAAPSDTALTISTFPGIEYMRDFGSPENLTPMGTGKSGLAGTDDIAFHFSWKGNVEGLTLWLDGVTKPFYLSWYHEPMGAVAASTFVTTCQRMVEILNAHPRKDLCLGNGPIVTRYWLDQGGGDPETLWYDGATMFCGDCYNGSSTFYRTAQQMFGSIADFARSKGVPWMVPEYGIERVTGDNGTGRSQAMEDHIKWVREQPDCLAVGWWNRGGNRITGVEPEQTTWRGLLAEQ